MGIDEALFGWLYRRISKRAQRESSEVAARAVDSEALIPRLRVLVGAAAGRMLEIRAIDGEGGLAGDCVLLPRRVSALPRKRDNERVLFVRAALAGALVRAGVSARWADPHALDDLETIEARLAEELPGWAALRAELPSDLPRWLLVGRLYPPAPRSAKGVPPDAAKLPSRVTTEREARRRPPPARRRHLMREDRPENPMTHSFEKVHTVEEHRGGSKRADGSDELREHGAALDEINPEEVVLSSETVNSVYKVNASFGSDDVTLEEAQPGILYDEWDWKRRRYLEDHCTVTVERPVVDLAAGAALEKRVLQSERGALLAVRIELAKLETALRWHTRQPDGPDVDLDALVDRHAALRAGHEGPSRLFVSRRRRGQSLAVMILVDASLSTDGWIANQRVLDLERDAATIASVALDEIVTGLSIAAFCSFSRQDCRFAILKSEVEPLARGLGRLARLEPRGYTRIGPALRHATHLLETSGARRRAIVLLSDGKPTDSDRYEGRHGLGDVRQAVREAKRANVDVFALAADPRSKPLLPEMFGNHGYAGLSTPKDVARAVGYWVTELMQ
ncbi:MAG: VWA domain-containing protein [Polyangiaceae bacterium]